MLRKMREMRERWLRARRRRRSSKPRSVWLFVELLEARCTPSVTIWKGAGVNPANLLWNDPNDWTNGVPGTIDKNNQLVDTATFDGLTSNASCFVNVPMVSIPTLNAISLYLGTLNISGSLTVTLGGNWGGTIAGGTFIIGPAATFNWGGGNTTIQSQTTVQAGGTLNLTTATNNLQGSLTNNGTVNLQSPKDLRVSNGASITNNANAVFDIQVDTTNIAIPQGGQAGTITNHGIFKKSVGANNTVGTTIQLPFVNDGAAATLEVVQGILSFSSTAVQNSGDTVIDNGAILATSTTYLVNNGFLDGGGLSSTLRGDLAVTGGTVRPGGAGKTGNLFVTNNYSQTGGTLQINVKVDPNTNLITANDEISVNNQLKLGGSSTLSTTNLGGATPANNQTITIIPYGSLLGDFSSKNLTYPGGSYTANTAGPGPAYQLTTKTKPKPKVMGLNPNMGPAAGGTSVVVQGSGFTGTTAVYFGDAPATSVTVVDDDTVIAVSPAHPDATVDVVVVTDVGSSPTSPADQFTFFGPYPGTGAPAVTRVNPSSGPVAGGNSVIITGSGFTSATAVSFGTVPAPSFVINSDTQITATAPAESAGTVDVTVTNPVGTSPTVASDRYTFVAPPAVTGVSPNSGPTTGGTFVTITGSGFTGATAVSFGGTASGPFSVMSDTQIVAESPAHAAGTVDITVTTPGGTSSPSPADQFTFTSGGILPLAATRIPAGAAPAGPAPAVSASTPEFAAAVGLPAAGRVPTPSAPDTSAGPGAAAVPAGSRDGASPGQNAPAPVRDDNLAADVPSRKRPARPADVLAADLEPPDSDPLQPPA